MGGRMIAGVRSESVVGALDAHGGVVLVVVPGEGAGPI